MDDVMLTAKQVAKRLGVTLNTVHRYAKVGILTRHKYSAKVVRYRLSEIEARQKEWADG
jgi:predicted site-specific integrase-resolvase